MTFEELYAEYWSRIYRLCKGYMNDTDLAKDLTQETFITVWQQLPKFRGESSVGTWIYRIATNKCLRSLETEKKITKTELTDQIQEEPATDHKPKLRLLQQYISELPETDRIIILLELEDVPQAEIAGIVGISESNVRVRIHRIKQKLTLKFREHEL